MEYQSTHKSKIHLNDISFEDMYIKKILSKYLDTEIDGTIAFIKFIFPFIRRCKNGQILGPKIIDDFRPVNDGAHGVTFRIQNILVKIFKNTKKSTITKIREIENIYKIFYNADHTRTLVPKQINNFIGFITNDSDVFNNIDVAKNKPLANHNIFTNLSSRYISDKDMLLFQKKNNFSIHDSVKITSLILEFEEFEIVEYVAKYVNKNNLNNFLNDFINDMYTALRFLHNDKKMIHNDIKYENIVTSFDSKLDRYVFKLIDFGLADSINKSTDIISLNNVYGTPLFFNGTIFKTYRSFLYDWHCIYITIFDLLNLSRDGTIDETNSESISRSSADPENEFLYIRYLNGGWIRSDHLQMLNIDSYMDYIHRTYMNTVDECLIDFMKSIMKFRFYIGDNEKYTINIRELYNEFYPDPTNSTNKKKICQKNES